MAGLILITLKIFLSPNSENSAGRKTSNSLKALADNQKNQRLYPEKYGSAENFILSANHKLSVLAPKIANELYSFKDEANGVVASLCSGQRKFSLKRAQILAIDILGTFNNKGIDILKIRDTRRLLPTTKCRKFSIHWYN